MDVGGELCGRVWSDGGTREALILLLRLLHLRLSVMLVTLLLLLLYLGVVVDTIVWLVATSITRGAATAARFGQATAATSL